ncbi:MAG: MerR family transcriptional regulator [Nostocoides sp.]
MAGPKTEATSASASPAPSGDDPTWTIAELGEEFDVTHRSIRHYEDLGMLSPERRGTVRIFHRRDRTRLALILRGKRLGFPLEEVRTIIDLYDAPRGKRSQLEYVLGQIETRRADLESRQADLVAALAELDQFEERCRDDLTALPPTSG